MRRGYTDTPWPLRMIGVYNLLCDNCNLLFRGFALPGTVPARGTRSRRQQRRRHHSGGSGGAGGRGE
ncbi:MAG: hypothetical protein ABW208_02030 [Pyrinomonadaceae bacterium]